MSKGLKMYSAKKKDAEGLAVKISKLSKADNKNLRCAYCMADIQYVSAYLSGASKHLVDAYLRLGKNEDHTNECKNSVKGFIDRLVADSNAIEDIPSIFELQEDGSFLFRMNLLVEAQKAAEDLSNLTDNDRSPKNTSYGHDYVRTGQRLESYFRSASGIAKLRALIKDSSDVDLLKGLVKIKYKNSYIKWDDFYYDNSNYNTLFDRVTKAKLSHPVAVNVTTKVNLRHSTTAKKCPWRYQCISKIATKNEKKFIYVPWLEFSDEKIANIVSQSSTYLIVGKVWAGKIKDEQSEFRHFNVSIHNRCQIKKETDEFDA